MKLVSFFNLIRWKNLLLITYVLFLIKFLLFSSLNTITNLNTFQFLLLWLSIIFITTAGYIINDVKDFKTDAINKPKSVIINKTLSIEKAKRWYFFINTIGIIIGVIFSFQIKNPTVALIFIFTSLLLNWYSNYLKSKPLVGNILVSFLVAFSFVLLAILDINYSIKSLAQNFVVMVIYGLGIVAFFITLIREIVKDIEDIKGDNLLNMKTLPIILGIDRTKKIAVYISVILILFLIYIVSNISNNYIWLNIYLIVTCILPLLYISIKLWKIKSYKKINKLSTLLKLIMFFGVNSILIISLIEL
jgi:4-hydroxybenzoate polyprenyltransferase